MGDTSLILVDSKVAAQLLGISGRHFHSLERSGRIGPMPVKLGRCCRWSVGELEAWAQTGALPRSEYQKNLKGK